MSKKSTIISIAAIVLVVAIGVGGWFLYKNLKAKPLDTSSAVSGETVAKKHITVKISDPVHGTEDKTESIDTDSDYLAEVLKANNLISTSESQYGEYIIGANGITADESKHEYWAVYVNGEYGLYGISEQPINDGDSFEIKLETY